MDGLPFQLKPGASYINERKSFTFHPQGSNIYKPGAGTKVNKLALTGQDWLEPTTFRVMFTLANNERNFVIKPLLPVSGPWSCLRRVRL